MVCGALAHIYQRAMKQMRLNLFSCAYAVVKDSAKGPFTKSVVTHLRSNGTRFTGGRDNMTQSLSSLARAARSCTLCASDFPLGPRPVLQLGSSARILVAAQAPGTEVHGSGRPFTDASGDRLRECMGIDVETFYDQDKIAILPMGFCYPGRGKSGDKPPRKECAPEWRQRFIHYLPKIRLTLVIG